MDFCDIVKEREDKRKRVKTRIFIIGQKVLEKKEIECRPRLILRRKTNCKRESCAISNSFIIRSAAVVVEE